MNDLLAHSDNGATSPIEPSRAQLEALLGVGRHGPVHMLNLLRFREVAEYPDSWDGPTGTGEEAYTRYGQVAMSRVGDLGGRVVMFGPVEAVAVGIDPCRWDQVAVIEYPDIESFLALTEDPAYVDALVHRNAGLAETEVLAVNPIVGRAY
ncbi:MAG: DUF1330 domain-containing protein [Acidimicrobiales bacterium]|nr:DUF1330 domain-containing protein [Acidimicrobiales bacterium]MDP7208515.1 DUF1330 domain-containing protein [Acidimicrobiales bacterium]HJO98626.1 DUF1330 domain-containing protein [Acidimicrobiales bacterium]